MLDQKNDQIALLFRQMMSFGKARDFDRTQIGVIATATFGDVVKEDGEDEGEGGVWREFGEHEAGVDKDVAFGVELRGLLAAL